MPKKKSIQLEPQLLESLVKMGSPNESILIHKGDFILSNDQMNLTINGQITFEWLPQTGAQFSGKLRAKYEEFQVFNSLNQNLEIIIDGLKLGDCYLTQYSNEHGNLEVVTEVRGRLKGEVIHGDRTIGVETIKFSVANLRDLPGDKAETKNYANFGRLKLDDDKFLITIDKSINYSSLNERLTETGGYLIQHAGEIRCKKGAANAADIRITIHILSDFLGFLNGRRTSALFATGIYQGEVLWCDYSNLLVSTYVDVQSWPSTHSIADIAGLWFAFRKLWEDAQGKTFLQSAIRWYIEANNNAGFTEGSIILAQTALELLYNWILIENKKLLLGKDAENLSASNKIRLLLAHLNMGTEIPQGFNHLKDFIAESNEITDAPEVIVQIRNAIVHSQQEKRKKLASIHLRAKHEALQISIWYIELALLNVLGYKGIYYNRCSPLLFLMARFENVPWASPNASDKKYLEHYQQYSSTGKPKPLSDKT